MLLSVGCAYGETGQEAWLRYEHVMTPELQDLYAHVPGTVVRVGDTRVLRAAQHEIAQGLERMLRHTMREDTGPVNADMVVVGRVADLEKLAPHMNVRGLEGDGYCLKRGAVNGHRAIFVTGLSDRGALYGAFALLRHVALHEPLDALDETQNPYAPIRWVNEWDNLDGSIERGYGGRSIFFDNGNVRPDLTRVSEYGRLLASVGVNGCTVNNVNANVQVLRPEFLPQLARIAAAFRPWGVRMSISVPFASPKLSGDLQTFDPKDPAVQEWWKRKADALYAAIPDLAGFLVKADSEGQAGPSTYGRSHADAANLLARALKPHGGVVVYRAFVYNHHADWRDLKQDRAKAAYDNFAPLDGKFDDNVVVQIKYGPIDFQAREPVSPLIGALKNTNEALELQITQEYTGQQRHVCFFAPMWKQVLNFDLRPGQPVKAIVSGKAGGRPLGGFVGVSDVGLDSTWMGSDMAQANLYGFGRLSWNPNLPSEQIADEWTRMTWGNNERVVNTIKNMQLESWRVYEGYTGPLGLGTLTDILHGHFGPGIESAERNGWGQWIRADNEGIGMERSVGKGTGYVGQYSAEVARQYEDVGNTPDELLLFMHHVPYSYVLHSGQTVIQYVYDSHYDAAAEANEFPGWWRDLHGLVDAERYRAVLNRLEFQAGHAIVWRDAICEWFGKQSGIPDARGRVGHYPGRVEAEAMQLNGYVPVQVTPWEDASGGHAVVCKDAKGCSAVYAFNGQPGWYELRVEYFDENSGAAQFRLALNEDSVSDWIADDHLPSKAPNGDTSVRHTVHRVQLRKGDEIRLLGVPEGGDEAALDYLELVRLEP